MPISNLPIAIGAESLPVISMHGLVSGRLTDTMAVAREIRSACETVGFFYVCDHGVPTETIESARRTCLEFYRRPSAEKERARVNEMHRGFVPMGQTHLTSMNRTAYLDEFVFVNLEQASGDGKMGAADDND